MGTRVTKRDASHNVARICGVTETDTKVQAAEKAIAVMKSAGMSTRSVERMLADYKRREGIS